MCGVSWHEKREKTPSDRPSDHEEAIQGVKIISPREVCRSGVVVRLRRNLSAKSITAAVCIVGKASWRHAGSDTCADGTPIVR